MESISKTVAIINPNASGGQTGKNWDSIYDLLKKYFGQDLEYALTTKSGDGTSFTRQYLEKGYTNIIAVGGDGLINEVANGFFKQHIDSDVNLKFIDSKGKVDLSTLMTLEQINANATLTVLPGGTRNVLVKSLNLPSDFEECCKLMSSSNSNKKIDVVMASVRSMDDQSKYTSRVFLNAAEIGLGAEIIDKSKTVRDTISSRILSTFAGILSTLPLYVSNVCEVIEGKPVSREIQHTLMTKMTMGVVANGGYLGGGFQLAAKANMSDGLLDTVIIKDSDSFKVLKKLMDVRTKDETLNDDNEIHYGQSETVAIIPKTTNKITVAVDGEPIGILPGFFIVFPQYLKIRV